MIDLGQLVGRINKALTNGSWTDVCGNIWTVTGNLLKSAQDPTGGNNAIDFTSNDTNNFIDLSNKSNLNIKDEWTVTFWEKGNTNISGSVMSYGQIGEGHGASIGANTSNVTYFSFATNSKPSISYTLQDKDLQAYNNWIFIEVNKDKNNVVSIFVNGEYKIQKIFDKKDSPYYWDRLLIGNWINHYWHNGFNGYLYDIRIYNYPLHSSGYIPDFSDPSPSEIYKPSKSITKYINIY